jgi:CheY-like chemotaxis protein
MSLRVLVVEDNPLNGELVSDLLEASGHSVRVATSGAAFRVALKAEAPPDIVLMDVLLPDTDGVKLLEEIRAMADLMALPVVAVTAQALPREIDRLITAGFDGALTKPIDTRTFVASVMYHASRPSAEKR